MRSTVDACPCRSCKPSDSGDRGLYSSLPIRYCRNSVLYLDFVSQTKFGGYDNALVVTCGLSRFTLIFPCTRKVTSEETLQLLLSGWFQHYGAPPEIHSDEDHVIRSETGWYKRALRSMNVHVSTGIPYTHTSNPLVERQNRVFRQVLRIFQKIYRTKDWVKLVPIVAQTMNAQVSSATGMCPHELIHGTKPWSFHAFFPEDLESPVGQWSNRLQHLAETARSLLSKVRERENTRKNKKSGRRQRIAYPHI